MDRLTVSRLSVPRTARVALLGADLRHPTELWIVLHGYRQRADRFLRHFLGLDDGTRRIAAPEGLSRFYLDEDGGAHGPEHRVGASWMTRHDREWEIADYVGYLDRVVAAQLEDCESDPRLVVLGFSQGVHTAVRWVVRGDTPPPHTTILWGAGPPVDLDPARAARRLARTRVVSVRGTADPHWTPAAEAAARRRWAEWGVDVREVEHPGGHRIAPELLPTLVQPG